MSEGKRLTRSKAIRAKCLDCCCDNSAEVKLCPVTDCPLYNYRLGRETGEHRIQRIQRVGNEKTDLDTKDELVID